MACSCSVVPLATAGAAGVIDSEVRVAMVAVIDALPLTVPSVAVTVELPGMRAEIMPREPCAVLTETDVAFEDAQVTDEVRSSVLLSLKRPMANSWNDVPAASDLV